MQELKGTYTCDTCNEKFNIYHHRAHPENIDDHINWLKKVLKADHNLFRSHNDDYNFPF